MAQTFTAKGTAVAKASGTTLTIPNLSMTGGDTLTVTIGYQSTDNAGAATLEYGGNNLLNDLVEGKTFTTGGFRMRTYSTIIQNTKTRDLDLTFSTATAARLMVASSQTQAGKVNVTNDTENIAATLSTTGGAQPIDHITTINMGYHMTNGPAGDNTGSSSTGHTLGQRVGTTGDTDTSNITIQETYKIIVASTVAAGSFVIGDSYQIKTVGTTDFTAIGAADNNIGTQFVTTGIGSGTGDAYHLEDVRSRLTGLTLRNHIGQMAHLRPKQTYTVKRMEQLHRLMNHNPDWVEVQVEDETGRGFTFQIDPGDFDGWSDALVSERIAERAATWQVNILDSNLTYDADSTRDTRMATFVNDQIIL